ncbi:e3 ubiquitin-protein ligase zswim2 [Acrodontium crateriforme]|uniref:E3 ubiquitin-protein ligase zswim2 n=1 Tax=Acrodontium crateriforme TaxID=150365 RepID=A0AAQ3M555_9PEZI|nr:e3 ubiquitin-protein ligase zswim2 [Acrodontium crateriforme]
MANGGLRRSTRARKPVNNYADELAEQDAFATDRKPTKMAKPAKQQTKSGEDDSMKLTDHYPSVKTTKKRSRKPDTEVVEHEGLPPIQTPSEKKTKKSPVNASWHEDAAEARAERTRSRIKQLAPGQAEKRLRPYVNAPNEKFGRYLKSATTQRMFVLERERSVEQNCHANHHDCPRETVRIAGSSGNVYTVQISHIPTCSCPVGIFQRNKSEQCCKHVLYILANMLKAPSELKYQNAFLTHELKALFGNAPIGTESSEVKDEADDLNRKAVSGDCPICFMEFENGDDIVWCRAACGNNIHENCFRQWEQSKNGRVVTCPFCRSAWESEAPKTQKTNVANISIPEKFERGYTNVRHLLDYGEG